MEEESISRIAGAWPWVIRVVWFALVVSSGAVLTDALSDNSRPMRLVVVGLAWLVWGSGLLATLIPHTISLVVLRCDSLGVVCATVWAALRVVGDRNGLVAAGLVVALAAGAVALSPETGHFCVNGSAYPNERRFLLRPGALIQMVVVPVSAVSVVVGVVAGPILLGAEQWVMGSAALIVGMGISTVLARSLYALAKRFVVFVPAGFVLHDTAALREPMLYRRQSIESIAPAGANSDALDLTLGAAGLAVEIRFHEKVELTRRVGRATFVDGRSARFLFVPTLPGRFLAEAAKRRISSANAEEYSE